MLSNVPFLLCKKTANIEIDLSNTLFSQHVNWSGQIIRQRNTLDAEFPEISQTCTKSIQHAQTLDLSSNNLSCPTKLSYQDPFYAYDHLGETSAIITGKVLWRTSTSTFQRTRNCGEKFGTLQPALFIKWSPTCETSPIWI